MKRIICGVIITIAFIMSLALNVYGYENEIYKIDIPTDYTESEYKGSSLFKKSNTENTGLTIISTESRGLKKDISTMSRSEINELISSLCGYTTQTISQGKEKLGNSNAIKARVKESDVYMDVYIVVSDQHILLICFGAPTEGELDSQEFSNMKKSFKMKEWTTNVTLIRVGIGLLVIGGGVIGYLKKRR